MILQVLKHCLIRFIRDAKASEEPFPSDFLQ